MQIYNQLVAVVKYLSVYFWIVKFNPIFFRSSQKFGYDLETTFASLGALIFCKTSKALKRVNNMFQNKEIQKFYWAIVRNKPKQRKDTLTHWLKKNPSTNTTKVYKKQIINSKKAILHYNLIKTLKSYYLLEINLETGRSHQIRTQLSFMGSPIKGDLKYGAKRSNSNGGIHLHAKKIKFVHPISKKIISIEADLPDDIIWKNCK